MFIFIRERYPSRIIEKLKAKETQTAFDYRFDDRVLSGWDRCLDQLRIQADIVFLGDSITHQSDFSRAFPDKTVCNLGISSNTIQDIIDRSPMVQTVHPQKIFLMFGINSLHDDNIAQCLNEYQTLVDTLLAENDADLYILSVLPVSQDKSSEKNVRPDSIVAFNRGLAEIASSNHLVFIDLYSVFETDGWINEAYTADGIHLTQDGYDLWSREIAPYVY